MVWTSETFKLSVSLIYALSYFVLFAVIFFYTKKGVHLDLVESFILFGWFAFLHGLADTMSIFSFEPLRSTAFADPLRALRVGLDFASMVALMAFCVKILIRDDEVRDHLNKYFYLVYGTAIVFILGQLILTGPKQALIFVAVYFGFPISLLTGAAFFFLARQSRTVMIKRLRVAFNGIALCFALFALLKAFRGFADTDSAIAAIRILRMFTALSLAGFTAVGLSRLQVKAAKNPPAPVPAPKRLESTRPRN